MMELERLAYRAKRQVSTFGWQRQCPCCGRRVREFLPSGGRPNQRCPRCDSRERHRSLWLYLEARTSLFTTPHRVLHVAPEPVLRSRIRSVPGTRYVDLDLMRPDVGCRADLGCLPFASGSFDAVLAIHVLEHIPDDAAALREIRRVLAPAGWAILQVPLDASRATTFEDPIVVEPTERTRLFGQDDHVRVYGRDYADRLAAAGLRVTVDRWISDLEPSVHDRFGLRDEPIYLATSP